MKKSTFFTGLLFIFSFICFQSAAQNAELNQLKFISPKPGALYASPHHNIILRHGDPFDLNSIDESLINVTGSISGAHPGEFILTADSRTLLFKPETPFLYNEKIDVEIIKGFSTQSGIEIAPFSFSFNTMTQDNAFLKENYIKWLNEENIKQFDNYENQSQNSMNYQKNSMELPEDYPPYYLKTLNNPTPGYLYVNPHNVFHPLNLPAYSIIMDQYGTPVYYKKFDSHTLDFNIQETGDISQFIVTESGGLGIAYGTFHTYDMNMNPIDTFQMGNGYIAEMHDFQLFNDGSYLLFTYDPQLVDMSQIVEDGDPDATVMGFVLQELDADDNVVFEWSSWDHMEITDATADIDLTSIFIDYCHGNAVERDFDGNILVSFRNTDEFIKIDRASGDIIWRWNSFREDLNDITFLNDTIGFSHQHDIRRLENGNITLFDNGNLHGPPPYSRILEYTLDEENKTAELVSVYPPAPGPGNYFAFATGSTQRLSSGNTAIGWGVGFGVLPMVGEITATGEVALEIFGIDTTSTYRARKYNWEPTLFSLSKDTIDWGEFTSYQPEPYILQVTNNSEETIIISGTHNRTEKFYVTSTFPININAGETESIYIYFSPSSDRFFEDVLTIMCEKGELEMLGKQVVLMGHKADESAPEASFDPEDETEGVIRLPNLKLTFDEKLYKAGGDLITSDDLQDILFLNPQGDPTPFKAWILWYDNDKTEIMVQPFDYLEANTQYTWGINSNTVEDWAGNGITEEVSATFITGEEMGVDDLLVEDFARVFPNPSSGNINLEFINNDEKSVMIYDVSGNQILSVDHLYGKTYYFDISEEPDGLYIIRIINKKTNSSVDFKLIKK